MQSSIYQEWIQEDIKEAVAKALTEAENKANAKAVSRAILEVLEERFDYLRKSTREKIYAIEDVDKLDLLLKKSIRIGSPEEFERVLEEMSL